MTFTHAKYQLDIIDKYEFEDYGGLFLDTGCRKTSTTIGILEKKIHNNATSRILIIGPSAVVPNWPKEILKFFESNTYPVHMSFGSKSNRKKLLENFVKDRHDKTGILVTNYEVATSSLGPVVEKFNPDIIVFDEAHMLKNPKGKRAKFFLNMRKKAKGCFILTGTIIASKITDAFMPLLIMDLGKTFGNNYWVFLRKYMFDKNEKWAGQPGYFPDWRVRKDMLPEFKEKISRSCVTVSRKEVLDLPPFSVENRYVQLSKEQERAYKELKKELITDFKDKTITVENALTKCLRLNQICSGHIGRDEELVVFDEIEKDKEFKNLVKEFIEEKRKFIVWTCFRASKDRVTRLLKECGIHNICFITGDQTGHEKAEAEYLFQNDPNFPAIVCNLRAGGTGINLQQASRSINFERNFSFTDAYQSEARNYRSGSEIHKDIVQYNLICKDTIEEDILDAVARKKELSDYVLDNIEEIKSIEKDFKNKILKEFGLY